MGRDVPVSLFRLRVLNRPPFTKLLGYKLPDFTARMGGATVGRYVNAWVSVTSQKQSVQNGLSAAELGRMCWRGDVRLELFTCDIEIISKR